MSLRVVVLMGGTSSERDVSLATGIRCAEALRACGHVYSSDVRCLTASGRDPQIRREVK